MVAPPALHPGIRAIKEQGDKLYAARDFAAAIEQYSEALESVEDAVVLSNRSATYAQRRKFDKALADAERALKLHPDWPRLHQRRGHALFHLGRYDEAIEVFEGGARLDPKDQHLQEALQLVREYTEPMPQLEQKKKPQRGGAFSTAASTPAPQRATPTATPTSNVAARPTGPSSRFVVVHEKVVEREEPSVQSKVAGVHFKGGKVVGIPCDVGGVPWLQLEKNWILMDGKSVGLGKLLEPDDSTGTPAATGSQSADQLREKGNLLFREKKYPAAIEAYTGATNLNPNDAKSWANRAAAQIGILAEFSKDLPQSSLEGTSYYKNALSDLETALNVDPGYIKAWARKGQLYSMVGNKEKALDTYNQGLKLDPNSPECKAGRDAWLNRK